MLWIMIFPDRIPCLTALNLVFSVLIGPVDRSAFDRFAFICSWVVMYLTRNRKYVMCCILTNSVRRMDNSSIFRYSVYQSRTSWHYKKILHTSLVIPWFPNHIHCKIKCIYLFLFLIDNFLMWKFSICISGKQRSLKSHIFIKVWQKLPPIII